MSDSYEDASQILSELTQREQQFSVHPLLQYDPEAAKWIKVIKASYFMSPKTKAPVPRNQDLPKEAFGELTGRCILAATSHAWFWQNHPDPEGVKLKLLRDFIRRLQKRYPETEIVIFDDWHSCPQWPRTKEQDVVFYKAMDHMNSMYVYCDVVLFLEAKLPDLDMTVRFCNLIPSNYSFGKFLDVTQFHGPESDKISIRKNDIVVKPSDLEILKSTLKEIEISFLKRPFGRPNQIPPDERGWLYAERITIAIKVATAGQHRFDDIVWSNNENLRTKIYAWARTLLVAAKKKEIRKALEKFQMELTKKRFTWPDNDKLVDKIITDLVDKFATYWKEEKERQQTMSTRAHEILLRWGEFSNEYIKETKLLQQEKEESGWMLRSFGKLVGLSIIGPFIASIPFFLKITDDCVESLIGHALWYGLLDLSVPFGRHTFALFLFLIFTISLPVLLFRLAWGNRLVPFLQLGLSVVLAISLAALVKIPFFKRRDERDGRVERYGLDRMLNFPKSMRHDPRIRAEAERLLNFNHASVGFALLYPLLGGVFFQAEVVLQACLIPVFFSFRVCYEFASDAVITQHFGSDKLPALSFFGIMVHEICLSVMITSIKHPLVFVTLVLADVCENAFCLWSLSRSKSHDNIIVPIDDNSSSVEKTTKSLTKRSSSVYALTRDQNTSEGTALFIAAILLQREMVEAIVPIQSAFVMSVLYASGVKSNSMVSQWKSDEDYIKAMIYLGIDLGVELVVFLCTVLALNRIYPKFSAWRILMGLVRSSGILMLAFTTSIWFTVLMFQNTVSGLDLSFQFKWLDCDSKNATWVGGFDWENCS